MKVVYGLVRWRPVSPAILIRGSSHSAEHVPQDDGFYHELNQRHVHQIFLSGVRFLKGDLDLLKRNLKVRDVAIDVDNMVRVSILLFTQSRYQLVRRFSLLFV